MFKKTPIIIGIILLLTNSANALPQTKIALTEIMPNPEGTDKNNEWIEIQNSSDETINLENWILEINQKKSTINKLKIPPHSIAIIEKENLKSSIRNTDSEIKLLNPQAKKIDSINFQKSKSGLSLTKTEITEEDTKKIQWLWTSPSKNKANQTFHKLQGQIQKTPQISKEYYFQIKTKQNKIIKIKFSEKRHPFNKIQKKFKQNEEITLIASQTNNEFWLENYSVKTNIEKLLKNNKLKNTIPQNPKSNPIPLLWALPIIIPLLSTIIFLTQKKREVLPPLFK